MTQPLPHGLADYDTERAVAKPGPSLSDVVRGELEQQRLCETLDAAADRVHERHWRAALSSPLLELLEREGKCFRSRLVQVAFEVSAGGAGQMPDTLPLIVEALHAGSLIIDDIQDDSKTRRGRPALHLLCGVPLALNAGNWLYFLPHRLLEELRLEGTIELELRRSIERCALRCHYGQALDLGVRLGALGQSEVFGVVSLSTRLKTGSLLELAAELGATAGGAPPEVRAALAGFARRYGVALQMLDDLSGLYRPERVAKGHEDLLNGCPTWPWAWLSERLDQVSYSRLQHQAQAVTRRELLPEVLASSLRKHLGEAPHRQVQLELGRALCELRGQLDRQDLLGPLLEEIERLERAYA